MDAANELQQWQTFLREQPNGYSHPRGAARILLYGFPGRVPWKSANAMRVVN